MAAARWAAVLGQTLRDALAFDRPGRMLQRDPATGAITGAIGARAPLPAVDPALAAAFPGRSPRELLAALGRGRGGLYEQLRQYGVGAIHRAGPRAPLPPRPPRARGPGARLGAAGLWDCERRRPVYYACVADGARLQRSPWPRLPVNPLPRGFGQTLRRLIRGGLRPRDAMREAWARVRANPGTRWHGQAAAAAEDLRARSEARGRLVGSHYYRGQRDAHRESQETSRILGLNPGAAWHREQEQLAEALARKDRRRRRYHLGMADAHVLSAQASRGLGLNPQVAFDPFDYASPAAAKKARDALYRQLRAAGHRPRRSVLRGQLEKYRGLGVEGRGVRDVYYVTWEDPSLPSEARVFGYRQRNPWAAWHEARRAQHARLARAAPKGSRRRAELRAAARAHAESARASRGLGVESPRVPGGRRPYNPRASRAAFCPEQVAPQARFDPRSFRTVASDGHRVTVGCPRGKWDPRRKRCKVGTQAQRILHPPGEATCPLPGRKGRRRRRNPLINPPARPVEIYRRVEFIGATKGPGGRHAGARFLHRFRTPARILGLPSGDLLIQAARGR